MVYAEFYNGLRLWPLKAKPEESKTQTMINSMHTMGFDLNNCYKFYSTVLTRNSVRLVDLFI